MWTGMWFCFTLFFLLSLYLMRSRMKLRTSLGQRFCTSLSSAMATGIVWHGKKKDRTVILRTILLQKRWTIYFSTEYTQCSNDLVGRGIAAKICWKMNVDCRYLLQEVALEAQEVVGLHDVRAALTAKHSSKQGLHRWRTLPRAHHGIGYLRGFHAQTHTREKRRTQFCFSQLLQLSSV